MEAHGIRLVPTVSAQSFTVTMTLAVEDLRALWTAAAQRAQQAPGMTLSDVLDTIGPREDPAVRDCLAMLLAPVGLPGCSLEAFAVAEDAELTPIMEARRGAWQGSRAAS